MRTGLLVRRAITVASDLVGAVVSSIPGQTGRRIRRVYYGRLLKNCGKGVVIDQGVVIEHPECVSLGDNVWLDKYCVIIAGPTDLAHRIVKRQKVTSSDAPAEGELVIGSNVHIAPFCVIQAHGGVAIGPSSGLSSNAKIYTLSNLPANPFDHTERVFFTPLDHSAYVFGPVVLGANVGVALNAVILPGVVLGDDCFVEPNSVVLASLKANSRVAGNPASRRGLRFEPDGSPDHQLLRRSGHAVD
jgi:galactoside O-acetyltransferase